MGFLLRLPHNDIFCGFNQNMLSLVSFRRSIDIRYSPLDLLPRQRGTGLTVEMLRMLFLSFSEEFQEVLVHFKNYPDNNF